MDTLSLQEIKEYLKTVFELETALYKHDKLVEEYTALRAQEVPPEPEKRKPLLKTLPYKLEREEEEEVEMVKSLGVAGLFFFLFGIFLALVGGYGASLIFLLIGLACLGGVAFCRKKAEDKWYERYSEWSECCRKIEMENQIIEEGAAREHRERLREYRENELALYTQATDTQLAEFAATRQQLKTSLDRLYEQNVLYAKYRNFVAVATIFEYFDSGRCNELEGPNGAYNMYEGELRSNIIVCSLSQIVSDLNQIKSGQYALYEQINHSNQAVQRLLKNIGDVTALTAYYAEATALAASADRITYGVVV